MVNLSTLNPEQRRAAETIHGPVLILAGAGTGKTRVITFRIAHMIAKGIPPDRILGVTFTNKAAKEMQERVRKLLPPVPRKPKDGQKPPRPTICTFHSLCVRILRQHIEKLGYKRSFVIYDETEQLGVVKKLLSSISVKGEHVEPGDLLALISKLKNGSTPTAFWDPSARAMAQHLRARYESALRACNAVDFDDLIVLTQRLFDQHPEALAACRQHYQYVMVDEYQDTNAAQFKLIHTLTSEHRNLCVVGDDDQSIYGWRGADISNLLDLEKHYPEVKVIKLEQNYRSTNTILKAANSVIRQNVRRRGKQLWSSKGEGERIRLYTFESDEEEARTVAELIEFARSQRIPWSDQAILFRTNGQSRGLETALRQAEIRYRLVGGQSFFDRREVRDLLAYLKMFVNPNDDISLLRIANVPARGLSETTMEKVIAASHERKCSVHTVMKNPVVAAGFPMRAQESIAQFLSFIDRVRHQLTGSNPGGQARPLQAWAEAFLQETGYFNELKRLEKNAETAEARIRNLKELLATADDVESEAPGLLDRLADFLETITLDDSKEEEEDKPENAVTLITMHSCKGLEFPHVYVVGLEDGLLPHTRSKEEGTLDEERRLFYVAITRAMHTLTLSYCTTRKKYGKPFPCHPSPFLKELPPELVENASEAAKAIVKPTAGKSLFDAMRDALGES